jgi:hypothetical protein
MGLVSGIAEIVPEQIIPNVGVEPATICEQNSLAADTGVR